jgi:gluconate 2-dehydrogenase gamma chain
MIYRYKIMNFSRRDWIFGSLGSISWAAIAAAQEHAHHMVSGAAPARFEFFDASTAVEIEAIASQILPSYDGPGAKEAGVAYFIDRALTTFDSEKQGDYRKGLPEIQSVRKQMFPASASIAALSSEQQVQLLRAVENSGFFEILRVHTVLGFLGHPNYGGNRGKVGWKYIGFEDRMSFQPPFGYYDQDGQ